MSASGETGEAFAYYKHVDELLADQAKYGGKTIQVHGFVQPETIQKRVDKDHGVIEYKFNAVNCGSTVEVRYAGVVPDTFKDRAEVVVKGKLDGKIFHANEISAKCPSKYEAAGAASPANTLCTRGDKNVEKL